MERQIITVDLSPGRDPIKRLYVTQGDVGRPLGVYITQDGSPFDLTGYTVDLYVLKSDRNYYTASIEIDTEINNLVIWDTAEQETILSGECAAQIRITDNSVNVGTADFVEYVEQSPMAMGVESETILSNVQIGTAYAITPSNFTAGKRASISGSQSKAGYYPAGIVGARCGNTDVVISGAKITSRSSGSVQFGINFYNAGNTDASMAVTMIDILWLKE